jgi:general secretion pathway protein G
MKKQSGFTLVEVVLVVILISIVAAIVIPRFSSGSRRAKVQACEMNRAIINTSVEVWYFTEGTWPDNDLWDMKTNYYYFPDGIPTCPVALTSYTLKMSPYHRVSGHREGDGSHIF